MIESKEKEINGKKVIVGEFPGRYCFKMQAKLVRLFGPVLGELLSGFKGKGDIKNLSDALSSDFDLNKISDAIRVLFEKLDEDSAQVLIFELLKTTKVDGEDAWNEAVFDRIFSGNLVTLYKIVGFVLEVNFSSFFGEGGIGKAIQGVKTQMQSISPKSSTNP
jgi:hypothetical protein